MAPMNDKKMKYRAIAHLKSTQNSISFENDDSSVAYHVYTALVHTSNALDNESVRPRSSSSSSSPSRTHMGDECVWLLKQDDNGTVAGKKKL